MPTVDPEHLRRLGERLRASGAAVASAARVDAPDTGEIRADSTARLSEVLGLHAEVVDELTRLGGGLCRAVDGLTDTDDDVGARLTSAGLS